MTCVKQQCDTQAISNYRATLDGTRSSDLLKNDDQWILNTTSSTPVLVPSNGYTFERTPWQVQIVLNPETWRLVPRNLQSPVGRLDMAAVSTGGYGQDLEIRRSRVPCYLRLAAQPMRPILALSPMHRRPKPRPKTFLHSRDELIVTQIAFAAVRTWSRPVCASRHSRWEWLQLAAGDPNLHGRRQRRPRPVLPQRPQHQQRHERD